MSLQTSEDFRELLGRRVIVEKRRWSDSNDESAQGGDQQLPDWDLRLEVPIRGGERAEAEDFPTLLSEEVLQANPREGELTLQNHKRSLLKTKIHTVVEPLHLVLSMSH